MTASGQFARFLATGGIALALHWTSRFVFNLFMPFEAAIVCAYILAMGVGYWLNRRFVFPRSGRAVHSEMAIFAVVNILSLPLVWAVSVFLGDGVFAKSFPVATAHALAHAIAIISPVLMNFILHKFWTFRPTEAPSDA